MTIDHAKGAYGSDGTGAASAPVPSLARCVTSCRRLSTREGLRASGTGITRAQRPPKREKKPTASYENFVTRSYRGKGELRPAVVSWLPGATEARACLGGGLLRPCSGYTPSPTLRASSLAVASTPGCVPSPTASTCARLAAEVATQQVRQPPAVGSTTFSQSGGWSPRGVRRIAAGAFTRGDGAARSVFVARASMGTLTVVDLWDGRRRSPPWPTRGGRG